VNADLDLAVADPSLNQASSRFSSLASCAGEAAL
jgi:hypothetical protein